MLELKMAKITFKFKNGEKTVDAPNGISLLEVAHKNEIPLEGACEGSLACSTCHVIIEDQAVYNTLPKAKDEEEDMLDLAFGLTRTSRLGCQIMINDALDGLIVRIPEATRNMQVK
jgi:2Fe-2S ferredoxin